MQYLKESSEIIYLDVQFEIISDRIGDFSNRGFIKNSNQSYKEAYDQRVPLYRKYANHIVENNKEVDKCVEQIISLLT